MPALFYAAPFYGSLQYGAYVFNNTTVTRLAGGPVYARDQRTVTHNQWDISFRTLVENSTGSEMALLLATLCEPGLRFVCQGRGLDSVVGRIDTGGYRDVNFGPKPRRLGVRPAAASATGAAPCFVDWSIEVAVPCCVNGRRAGPMELTAEVSFEIDYAGRVTRRWAGELRIANNVRADGRGGTDSPDEYRDAVTPDLLPNFDREFGPWRTSDDRTRLGFEVIDRQRPSRNVPPPYTVGEPKLSHHAVANKPDLRRWVVRFSGEYELAPDAPDVYAPARHFFETFVGGRIEWLRRNLGKNKKDAGPKSIVPLGIEFGEPNALGRPVQTFGATLSFVVDTPADVLFASGVYRPVNGSASPAAQWAAYAKSLLTSAYNPYGVAQLRFEAADDRLITGLCDPRALDVSAGDVVRVLRNQSGVFDVDEWLDRILSSITAKSSWVDYENRLTIVPETGTVEVRTLPPAAVPGQAGGMGAVLGAAVGGAFDAARAVNWEDIGVNIAGALFGASPGAGGLLLAGATGAAAGAADVVAGFQQRVPDRFKVVMEGYGVRARYAVPVPTLTEIGGVKALPVFDRQRDYVVPSEPVRNVGVPLYRAAWRLTFAPASYPLTKPIEQLPNPLFE